MHCQRNANDRQTLRSQIFSLDCSHSSDKFTEMIASVSKARFPLAELTARVNGQIWRVTGFHYSSTHHDTSPRSKVQKVATRQACGAARLSRRRTAGTGVSNTVYRSSAQSLVFSNNKLCKLPSRQAVCWHYLHGNTRQARSTSVLMA